MTIDIGATPNTGITEGMLITLTAPAPYADTPYTYVWSVTGGVFEESGTDTHTEDISANSVVTWDTTGLRIGAYRVSVTATPARRTDAQVRTQRGEIGEGNLDLTVYPRPLSRNDTIAVSMRRTAMEPTTDQALWVIIRNRTRAISFNLYKKFIDDVMCHEKFTAEKEHKRETREFELRLPFPGVDAYNLLKVATELFLMQECGVEIKNQELFQTDEETRRLGRPVTLDDINRLKEKYLEDLLDEKGTVVQQNVLLPYLKLIRDRLKELPLKLPTEFPPNCYGILRSRLTDPCLLELIWSYWHEEGMLVQTLKAISLRFQNRRGAADRDPLAHLDIDPLRLLNNLLWGYIQDEQHRLSIVRRTYEYDHHYGLTLYGKAVSSLRSVDGRSKFLEAFHNLLHLCSIFFKEDDDTTVIADGFPVLNALREVHLLLAEGAHNQFGDLPSTARQEMLIEQWLLARPEMREFLRGRIMVPYPQEWMDCVDTMKTLQGWTDVSVREFHDLAEFGEQIVLSIRYGNWNRVNDPAQAANWARYWRPDIQRYIHAYRAVTGVDLTSEPVDYTLPSIHLRNRLASQVQKR